MGMLSESQETYCSQFQEISKSGNLKNEIKSIQLHLTQMQLKLNNYMHKKLNKSQLKTFRNELQEIKEKYWLDLHFKTKKSIDRKLDLIEGKLNNNDCSKNKKDTKKSTRVKTLRSQDNATYKRTLEKKKQYNTRSKMQIMCPQQSETSKNKSSLISKKLKVDSTNSKPKNLVGKLKKQINKCGPLRNQVKDCEQPYKSLSNTFPQESISSGFNYGKFLPNTQPIPKPNLFQNILSDIQRNTLDELDNLNPPSLAETYNTAPYNPEQKISIKETVFCLTEQHCKKLARSLKLNEQFLINQIYNILENDEIDEFDDVSVIGPSQSPINYKVWKNQRLNRTKVSLNTELENFSNYFVDNVEFDLQKY